MVIPTNQQAYSVSQGTSTIPAFVFQTRDPTVEDTVYQLYTRWVNTITKGIWYLEAFVPSDGFITAQWRAVGPIVVSEVPPTTSDYLYPIGQTWIDTVGMNYWGLVNVTGTVATWEDLSSGVAAGILTLTGNTGGSVAGDGSRNVDLIGSGGVTVTGNPGTHTLTISLTGGSTAIDSVGVDAFTGPGTNPVLPDASGEIFVTGGQISAASTANVIRTDSIAANTYTVQVQRSKVEPVSTVASNGVSHFNSGDFTIDNNAFVSLSSPGSTAFTAVNIQTFTSSGTYTPTTGMKYCIVEIVAGGGGGGGGTSNNANSVISGGGGGGAYTRGIFNAATIGASKPVTIGTGGSGGGSTGNTGGTSSFGSLLSVAGGLGGVGNEPSSTGGNASAAGGSGGSAITSGSFSIQGCPGDNGWMIDVNQAGILGISGYGGSTFMGEESAAPIINTGVVGSGSNGTNGLVYGGGGSGAVANNSLGPIVYTGGTGAAGICVITEYI